MVELRDEFLDERGPGRESGRESVLYGLGVILIPSFRTLLAGAVDAS